MMTKANTQSPPVYSAAPGRTGKPVVLWLQPGPEHYFVAMLDKLNTMSGSVRFHALYLNDEKPNSAPQLVLKHTPATFVGSRRASNGIAARSVLDAISFDAAVVGGYNTAFRRAAIRYCGTRGLPVVMFADSNLRSDRGTAIKTKLKRLVKHLYLRRLCRSLDAIVPCNRLGIAYWRYYGAQPRQIHRSTYFCSLPDLAAAEQTSRARVLERYQIPINSRVLFTAARLVPVKALHLMIQAFTEAKFGDKGWIWLIAGSGPLRDELTAAAKRAAGDRIRFLGFVPPEDVKALARHSELFVLPSIYEPHGIVVPEALAVGTPVIASDICGAAHDLVEEGKTGWIFKNGSVQSLREKLVLATDNLEGLAAMRPACRARFLAWYERFGPEHVFPELLRRLLIR